MTTRDVLGRARWREDGRYIHLVAARRDGGATLATIDLDERPQYVAALHTGERITCWPLNPLQRWVRRRLRDLTASASERAVAATESTESE